MFKDYHNTMLVVREEIKSFNIMMKEGLECKFDNSPSGIKDKLEFIEERLYYHVYLMSSIIQAKQLMKDVASSISSFDLGREANMIVKELDFLFKDLNTLNFSLTQLSRSAEIRLRHELSVLKDLL